MARTSEIRFAGKTALPGVFANQFFVGRDVNAINAIVHDVAFDPLNLWSEVARHSAGFLRNGLELLADSFPAPGISLSITYLGITSVS